MLFCVQQLTIFAQEYNLANTATLSKSVDKFQDKKIESNISVKSLAPALKKVLPSVVNVYCLKKSGETELEKPIEGSIGSGVIIDSKNGYVVTNNHVVEIVSEGVGGIIWVTLSDYRKLEGTFVASDIVSDLAVIKIRNDDLVEAVFGDSSTVEVGDFVVAIGNPLDKPHSVTFGIVSALDRGAEHFIQTDASINPGNSGGALINMKGELIGINTRILQENPYHRGSIGMGLSIPSNIVKVISKKLIDSGKVEYGNLGIIMQNIDTQMLEALGLNQSPIIQGGVIILKIQRHSPAEKSKLKVGDIIVSIDDQQIRDASDIYNMYFFKPIGTQIVLKVIRNKRNLYIPVQVEKFDEKMFYYDHTIKHFDRVKGVDFSNISKEHELYGQQDGIVVVDVDKASRAYDKGIRKGDLIVSINQVPIKNVEEFETELNNYEFDSNIVLNAQNKGGSSFIVLKLG